MAAAPTKNQKIEALVKLVQRKSRGLGLPLPQQRSVLETLMYAALLENATYDKADIAYTVLENYYIDWNEIRVCSLRELADTLSDLPHPEAAAERVRKALQGIFEKTYTFDLEEMRKKGKALAEHIKSLEAMSAGTPFMVQYVAQVALDGHLIPLDEASMRIMRRLNLSHISTDGMRELCVGLDRVILKKGGLTFAVQLHHFAAGYYDIPDSTELLSQLSAIDREAVNRSWSPPVLTSLPSAQPPKLAATPGIQPARSKGTESLPPAKPVAETVKKSAKPVKKPLPPKPDAKESKKPVIKKPVKPTALTKKSSAKKLPEASPGKKSLPKKNTLPAKPVPKKPAKPTPPKKKVDIKKSQAKNQVKVVKKPVAKSKAVSPSKALRKRKPK